MDPRALNFSCGSNDDREIGKALIARTPSFSTE
jgi:hypothetical protein